MNSGQVNYPTSLASASSLDFPQITVVDSSGSVFIADYINNRVLFYTNGSLTSSRVYGQGGSFTATALNNGGISANSLGNPQAIAFDSSGGVYLADASNSRVLFFQGNSTTASRVYGQGGSFATNTANKGGISASSLYYPHGLAVDPISGGLIVCDYNNNRVLFYPAGSTIASRVYGQSGSFTTSTANLGGASASSLSNPYGVAMDASGNLFISDSGNNRVLFFLAGSTVASRVYGQLDFTSLIPRMRVVLAA